MADLIDRQAAIEAFEKELSHGNREYAVGFVGAKRILEEVPSAQPEIVRCKDCRWGREVCGNIECFADINVPTEYHGYEWYCPIGERKDDELQTD